MKLRPNKFRNGIYIACLIPSRAMSKSEKEMLHNDELEEQNEKISKSSLTLEQNMNIKKKKKLKKKIKNNTKNNNIKNSKLTTRSVPNLKGRRRSKYYSNLYIMHYLYLLY